MSFPLPPELLVIILDFIAQCGGLRRTMKECALVSKTWCTVSQPLIFEHIRIELSKTDTEEWLERLRGSPHLSPMVRHITLASGTFDEEKWQSRAAEALGRELAHVRSLTLRGLASAAEIRVLDPHIYLLRNIGSKNGGLQVLRLNYVDFTQTDDLFRYFSVIPGKVTTLTLKLGDQMDLGHSEGDYHLVKSREPWPLRRLTLYHTSLQVAVLAWLLGPSVRLAELQFLALAIDAIEDPSLTLDPLIGSLLSQIVSKVGSTITSLTLAVWEDKRIRELTRFDSRDNILIPVTLSLSRLDV